MSPEIEKWMAYRRASAQWHNDGTVYLSFNREPDCLVLQCHAPSLEQAIALAKTMDKEKLRR